MAEEALVRRHAAHFARQVVSTRLQEDRVMRTIRCLPGLVLALCIPLVAHAQSEKRITILYDAFGPPSSLKMDWGFAALIEYDGRRILFDTGNNAKIFEHNVSQLNVDLSKLDAVVISHRHGDHTSGLNHLMKVNPGVKIYAPQEGAYFNTPTPVAFLQRTPGLPPNMSYYRGAQPDAFRSGSPWPDANFEIVRQTTEIFPGFFVLTTVSEKPGTRDMNEVSLAIKTPQGLAVVVGCSHPGVEKILANAASIDRELYTVTGGFHLVMTPAQEVQQVAATLFDKLKIKRVAPGHCTSELGFKVLMEQFKDHFDQAGLGQMIALP
jgi:7,8-dihydropterin-6-yl-methyl-4-(beta-D-ribofuranosyl)aminobenzene 5'-phosphate synthase